MSEPAAAPLEAPAGAAPGWDPMSPPQLEDPYPAYARMRREAPVFYSPALACWVVSRHQDICAVLRDPGRFSSAGVLKAREELPPEVREILAGGVPYVRTLLDNDPPGHTRFRSLVSKVFAPQRMAELEPRLYQVAGELIDGFVEDGRVDVMRRFAFPLPGIAIAEILGVPRADLPDLKRWCDGWMALQSASAPVDELKQNARSYLALQRYFLEIVEVRARSPRDDLVSAVVHGPPGEAPLTRVEIVRLLMSVLVAGHESTTYFIGNALVLLLDNPDQLGAVLREPRLAAAAVEEALRMDAPIQRLFRRATCDVELGGARIARGGRVLVVYGAGNRDASQFDAPDRFDVCRPEASRHLSFGRGAHFCVGAAMARMEGRIALELLTRRLPNLRLDETRPLERLPHFFLRGFKELILRWDAPPPRPRVRSWYESG